MTSTSLMGGGCQERETGGMGNGAAVVTPWAAGMYEKVKAFEIDRPGDAFPFSARLAKENGWTASAIGDTARFAKEGDVAASPAKES